MVNVEVLNKFQSEINQNGKIIAKISGRSMHPLIKEGELIEVKKISHIDQIKRFDILVFFSQGQFICHYLWHRNKHLGTTGNHVILQTRPLNPIFGYDTPISSQFILGVVKTRQLSFRQKFQIFLVTLLKRN